MIKSNTILRAAIGVCCIPIASLMAAEWHVSPNGSDTASGTSDAPFKSIARGAAIAQSGDTVLLHDGVYRETIRPVRSGKPDAPITLRNAPGATPVISARDSVAGPWEVGENGIYHVPVPAAPLLTGTLAGNRSRYSTGVDQVFIDGKMQPEARFPNKKSPDPMEHDGMGVTVSKDLKVTSKDLAGFPADFFAGARFLGRIHPNWTAQCGLVSTSQDGGLSIQPDSVSSPWWPNPARATDADADADADADFKTTSAKGEAFVYGTKNLIDADGEWCLTRDATGETLHLHPPLGRDPSTLRIERKVRPWTIDLGGHDHWILSGLRLDGGSVRLDGSGNVLEKCGLEHPGHFMIFTHGYSGNGGRNHGAGIFVEGSNNIVRHCVIRESAGSGIQLSGNGHLISHNQIYNTDYSGTYSSGIAPSGSGHRIEFNTIRDTGRDSIAITGGGHSILYNDLSRAGRLAMDGGMIYTYCQNGAGPDGKPTQIAFNWVHESGNPADPKSRGVYIDNYSRNFSIHHNVIWGLGALDKNKGLHVGAPSEGIEFYHNTLIGCLPPTRATFTKFPLVNRDPEFWTKEKNQLNYSYQNNLHLPGSTASEVLENAVTGDYRSRAGSPAIDPPRVEGKVRWETSDGKTGVPADYVLYSQDPSVPFRFWEINGHGVNIPGINDGFIGLTPDDGAYERGQPLWRPGHEGVAIAP